LSEQMQPVMLIILDGWGCQADSEGNAVARAATPAMDYYREHYPDTLLEASGESVGLPTGQMGNSEVGHLNIGAGKIVYQEISRIDKSIETGEFYKNEVLEGAIKNAARNNSSLHLMGLVSDGGVHSHLNHLKALLCWAKEQGLPRVYIHAILDGRDVPPTSAEEYMRDLMDYCEKNKTGSIATVSGRYYAMDRDKRWERTSLAYQAFVYREGLKAPDPISAVFQAYERGENDEFVVPTVIEGGEEENEIIRVSSEDSLVMFNFRPDRMRQITRAFFEESFEEFNRGEKPAFPHMVSFTEYDVEFPVPVAFPPQYLKNTLGEWTAKKGYSQLRLAETEKYAHVTFFLNGGREEPFTKEERCLIPSPRVATYDLQPEMSAPEVGEKAREILQQGRHPLVVVNFANADMVGHSGIMEAAVKAVEVVDREVGLTVETALKEGYFVLITGDHGNAEKMIEKETGEPHTAHTTNKVPFLLIGEHTHLLLKQGGKLADIAPTLLELCGLDIPGEMTGKSLLQNRAGNIVQG